MTLKRIVCFFIILAAILSLPLAAYGEGFPLDSEVQVLANAVYLVNLDTGRVVYEKNAEQRISPASTTKIMSAALAMELSLDLAGTVVTVPEDVWAEFYGIDISSAGLAGGEELTLYDLIHCMLLQSANEAASAVAAHYGREEFLQKMNDKARALGCTDTHFTNPHGLYDGNHYSTAKDLAKITEWAVSVPGFLEIACKSRYTLPETNKNYEKTLVSTILMQDPNSGYYTSYIRGVKTGTIPESGRCLISTAEQNDMRYLLVLMGCPMENTAVFWGDGRSYFNETRTIYDWAFSYLRLLNVVNPDTVVTEIPLKYAAKRDSLVLYPVGELDALIDRRSEEEPAVRYEITMPEYVEAPVETGDEIGSARVYADEIFLGSVKLVSRETVEYSWFVMVMEKMTDIFTSEAAVIIYIVLFFLLLFYLYYIAVLVKKRRAGNRRRTPGGRR